MPVNEACGTGRASKLELSPRLSPFSFPLRTLAPLIHQVWLRAHRIGEAHIVAVQKSWSKRLGNEGVSGRAETYHVDARRL